MRSRGLACGVAATLLGFVVSATAAPGVGPAPMSVSMPMSPAANALARQVEATRDHRQRPYAIVDKRQARIFVFEAGGRLAGSSPVLLGATPGDVSPPDIAQRAPASLRPHERITPAGRFESEPGHNDQGEAIVWIDYEAALALHRLRPSPPHERRAQRLATPTPDDNRISLGCVIVPVAFYDEIVAPLLGRRRGVVYVLSESGALPELAGAPRWD